MRAASRISRATLTSHFIIPEEATACNCLTLLEVPEGISIDGRPKLNRHIETVHPVLASE